MTEDIGSETPKIEFKHRSLEWRRKHCPNCLAELVVTDSLSGWLLPTVYTCEKCGYHGPVALEANQAAESGDSSQEQRTI